MRSATRKPFVDLGESNAESSLLHMTQTRCDFAHDRSRMAHGLHYATGQPVIECAERALAVASYGFVELHAASEQMCTTIAASHITCACRSN